MIIYDHENTHTQMQEVPTLMVSKNNHAAKAIPKVQESVLGEESPKKINRERHRWRFGVLINFNVEFARCGVESRHAGLKLNL